MTRVLIAWILFGSLRGADPLEMDRGGEPRMAPADGGVRIEIGDGDAGAGDAAAAGVPDDAGDLGMA